MKLIPECGICGETEEVVYKCKVCGIQFCEYCGSPEEKICIDCQTEESEEEWEGKGRVHKLHRNKQGE